jgi:hypothetical protein
MNPDLAERLLGKRFSGLLVAIACLTAGFFWGKPEMFSIFASTIGLIYGAYVGGQSYTDAKKQ